MNGPSIWKADIRTHFDSSFRCLASISARINRRCSNVEQQETGIITSTHAFRTPHTLSPHKSMNVGNYGSVRVVPINSLNYRLYVSIKLLCFYIYKIGLTNFRNSAFLLTAAHISPKWVAQIFFTVVSSSSHISMYLSRKILSVSSLPISGASLHMSCEQYKIWDVCVWVGMNFFSVTKSLTQERSAHAIVDKFSCTLWFNTTIITYNFLTIDMIKT